MFGIKKEHLVKNLCRLACRHCAYMGQMCDCKYMEDTDEFLVNGSERGSGCPESMMVAVLIEAMTDDEYYEIAKRAGIDIWRDPETNKKLTAVDVLKKFKIERDQIRTQQAKQIQADIEVKKQNRKKTTNHKSAYKPGKLPLGVK